MVFVLLKDGSLIEVIDAKDIVPAEDAFICVDASDNRVAWFKHAEVVAYALDHEVAQRMKQAYESSLERDDHAAAEPAP